MGEWKLFVVVIAAVLASLIVESNASEGIGEWQILTKQNFSSQIRLHPHILLLVTLPWSGESRALMKDISHLIINGKESYASLKLMFMYKNMEKMLAHAIGASSEETNIIFYHHSVSYKYRGRLTAQNIIPSIYSYVSLLPEELPLKHLKTPEDLNSFLDSTDKALLLMEFCGWTSKLLSQEMKNNISGDLVGTSNSEHVNRVRTSRGKNNKVPWNKNTDMKCSIENVPWVGEFGSGNETSFTETKSTNQCFPSSCKIEEFKRYSSFFTSLLAVARDFFLPSEKHGFGLISDRLLLSSLSSEASDSWFAALYFAGCPSCSKILREDDDLKRSLQMDNVIVSELEVDGSDLQPALPVNKPSIILFVDRFSNLSESRRESMAALRDFRELAQEYYSSSYPVGVHVGSKDQNSLLEKYPNTGRTFEHPRLKLSPASQMIKLEDKMSAVMFVNEGKLVTLDTLASDLQGNSLPEMLSLLLRKKEAKLSSLAKNLGFQLLSEDIEIKVASALPEEAEIRSYRVSSETAQEGTVTHTVGDQSNNGGDMSSQERLKVSDFSIVESTPQSNEQEKNGIHAIEHQNSVLSDESSSSQKLPFAQDMKDEERTILLTKTSTDANPRLQGFEGSFFFSDGNYRLLKALTGQSKTPALVIVDPLVQQHYVYPAEQSLSYSSQAGFLSSFLNRSLLPYQQSESVPKSPRAAIRPPFVNLDFHEVDSIPRVTALTFSELVLGLSQSESLNANSAYSKDVLVLFSNNWCGFCLRMEVVVREAYRAIQGYIDVLKSKHRNKKMMSSDTLTDQLSKLPLIYLMDCTLNGCSSTLKSMNQREVYPALILFPAERKKAILYEGDIAVNDIIKFVAEQGSNSQHLINQKGTLWTVAETRMHPKSFEDTRLHIHETSVILKEKLHEVLMRDRKVGSSTRFGQMNPHTAHDLDESAPRIVIGSILVATEKLAGVQLFENAHILIVKADQNTGFQGLIINKHIRWESLQELGEGLDMLNEAPLSLGGPLIRRKMPLLALTRRVLKDPHREILPAIYFLDQVATANEIEEINLGNHTVSGYWFFMGYSSWGWHQLYDEIAEGAWTLSEDGAAYLDWPEI